MDSLMTPAHTQPAAVLTVNTALAEALRGSVTVATATPARLEYVLAQAMAKAFADMGYKADERADEVLYLVQNLPAEVLKHLPAMRLDELPIAINLGILRHFGNFYGLNLATFMFFLNSHYQSNRRAEAVKQALAAHNTASAPPSPAERQAAMRRRIVAAYQQYLAQGYYTDYGNLVFDGLNRLYKIPFGPEREAAIWQQARQNLQQQYSKPSIYPRERQKLRAALQ